MATATSRMSLDPPPSVIDLPLPNPHARVPDLPPPARPLLGRVSSDSQTPGCVPPSPRITRRTPVPFLLEAFPAPPSHIPGTPTSGGPLNGSSLLAHASGWLPSASADPAVTANPVSSLNSNVPSSCSPKSVTTLLPQSNPPPSLPPTVPLPPVPGPSIVRSDFFTASRALQAPARSASPALSTAEFPRSQSHTEQRPRSSVDVNEPVRARGRQGSLSSLRNPVYPVGERSETIAEEPVVDSRRPPPSIGPPLAPIFGSVAERKSHDRLRGDSPDILHSNLPCMAAAPPARSDDKPYIEDSIASVDMSDLNALKSDNEGDVDDRGSRPFPRFPLLPRSQPQSPSGPPPSAPSYVHPLRKPSVSSVHSASVATTSEDTTTRHRAMSPEITHIITATPRPWKRSMSSRSRDPSSTRDRKESTRSRKGDDAPPVPTSAHIAKSVFASRTARSSRDNDGNLTAEEDDGNGSDSSLDLHTPLPQLMLRHGMLSPHSKLLPRPEADLTRLSIMSSVSSASHVSNASNLSLMSTKSTSSKHPKDARDTLQRRTRHRDGKLLKGGIGLTTGLGWSDSEDENAPSPLTRRVSTLVLSRRASSSSIVSYRSAPSQATSSNPYPLSRSISHSVLREADENENEHGPDELGHSHRSVLATRSLPSKRKPLGRVGSSLSAGSSLGRYSTHSTSSAHARVGSASESSISPTSVVPHPDNAVPNDGHSGAMPGIREQDDGVTPTRAAFERSGHGSLNGGSVPDPHTPSSTASSASLPFPATPESTDDIPPLQSAYNQDKTLPPLPLAARGKYPSSLGLRAHPVGSQRPRTYSNASSLSNTSMLGIPSAGTKGRSPSPTSSTPRPSLAERPPRTPIPPGSPRLLNATPRPSLTIPKSPLAPQSAGSGLPRPTTPSSAPSANASQKYAPRPLRLVSRSSSLPSPSSPVNPSSHPLPNQVEPNQTATKILQPGELPPRTGQVLVYNRNVHDQLKLRALSLNTGANRAPGPVVSPGGTQTLFIPSPEASSSPNSPLSTPITARSQSPIPSTSPGGENPRPRPRTGTGMVYRNNLSVASAATSRIRAPSTFSR